LHVESQSTSTIAAQTYAVIQISQTPTKSITSINTNDIHAGCNVEAPALKFPSKGLPPPVIPFDPSGFSSDPVVAADLDVVVFDEVSEVVLVVEEDAFSVEALVVVDNIVLKVLATVVLDTGLDREIEVDVLIADVAVVVLDCTVNVA
jgi:hypothetical protein